MIGFIFYTDYNTAALIIGLLGAYLFLGGAYLEGLLVVGFAILIYRIALRLRKG